MTRILILLGIMLCSLAGATQDFSRAEYFFDTDPGTGNGTPIALSSTASPVTFTTAIPTASLSPGFHHLGIRIKQQTAPWSMFEARGFYISTSTGNSPNISAAEYFFDTDPGNGNGTPISVTTGSPVNFTITIPSASLASGFHFLSIRTKSLNGAWGIFERRGFYVSTTTTNTTNIVAAEYFYDTDPGPGNATSIPVTAGATVNFTVALPATSLTPGFHFLSIRTKDTTGKWGGFESRGFYVSSSTTNASNIAGAEYFFDADPGQGNGTPIPVTAGTSVNLTATLPITGLTRGFHFLVIRTRTSGGQWGVFESRGFYVSSPVAVSNIVALEYFVDTDPGIGNGEPLDVNPVAPDITQTFTFGVSSTLGVGQHMLRMRAKDSEGFWSEIAADTFNISNCIPPIAPVSNGGSRCGEGAVTLTASGALSGNEYRWYASETSLVVLATGDTFTTPSLSSTTTYYVSVFNTTTTCESSRVPSIATVTATSKPALNVSGTISFCEGNSVFIVAPVGFPEYSWSDGRTSQQILVSASGTYTVKTGDGLGCQSESSDPIVVSVIAAPAKPQITVTGSTTLCGAETATLSGPAGFQYLWSNGATTRDITVNASGTFSVSIRNAAGCQSASSEAVTISTVTEQATIVLDGQFLIANAGENYKWFLNGSEIPGATSRVLEINSFEFGVYAVEVTTGSCFSRSEDFIYLITADKPDQKSLFTVTPNPVDAKLKVHTAMTSQTHITVFDAAGKKVFEKNITQGDHEFNVSFLSSGAYYLVAETSQQSKVIKLNKL